MTDQIIQDEVQAVRKDGKAIEIKNVWYNFFKPNLNVKKGQIVKLSFKVNKGFNNIQKFKILEKLTELNNAGKLAIKPEINNDPKIIRKLDNTTLNSILMVSATIFCSKKNVLTYEQVVENVIKGYKKILEI